MHDEGVLAAEVEEVFNHLAQERSIGHLEYLVACMGWIGQRAKDIEHGANANFTTGGANMFHSRMKGGGKHEAKAHLLHTACHLLRARVDTPSQRLQHVCAATATGS